MSRDNGKVERVPRKLYETELARLQVELARMQYWLREEGLRVVVVFEGRDAAGKGGTIKRIMEPLNPRQARIAALPAPSEREQTQWYFQRYAAHMPSAGEIVLFDRSWYNRAGVERVLGFCTPAQHQLFLRQCPAFERMLIDDGILLMKYWFSVSDEEQLKRFRGADQGRDEALEALAHGHRVAQPLHRLPRAKDEMIVNTELPESPGDVEADDKRRARRTASRPPEPDPVLRTWTPEPAANPRRQSEDGYRPPDRGTYFCVPRSGRR